jgi:membrane protein DedA with SNARE-associated domain
MLNFGKCRIVTSLRSYEPVQRGPGYRVGVTPVLAAAASGTLPSVLNGLPTALAVAALCVAVVVEIVVVPAVLLPGGTVTLLAGALIGSGRPAVGVSVPMVMAVIGADQLAFFGGAALIGWWERRHAGRAETDRVERARASAEPRSRARGRAAMWLTAAMPSVAGAVHMPYRAFAARMLIIRVPWLAAALSAGTLAARSLAQIGHVAGIVGVVASAVVVIGFLVARHRPLATRVLVRGTAAIRRKLSRYLAISGNPGGSGAPCSSPQIIFYTVVEVMRTG